MVDHVHRGELPSLTGADTETLGLGEGLGRERGFGELFVYLGPGRL